uniref:Fibronectin type-III domain-containing protein n=2 Tax=Timema TaxID=61471 RepID=A0A7R9B9J4_TIMSH|nr:unnamed protein product [Timema shepardi]CAD7580913.1 unnamed protein product [Timema californicum]
MGPERVHVVKPVLSILGPRSVAIKWQDTPCADQFSVCWGSWPDKVLYTCHTDTNTNTSLTVTGLQPTTKYTFILTALGSNRERSDPFVFAVLMPRVKTFKSGRT